MPPILHKLLLVVGALGIAALITWLPWEILYRMTGPESQFMGMTMILWAPAALLLGVAAGIAFAFLLWPRKSDS